MNPTDPKSVEVVVPVYNEEAVIAAFYQQLSTAVAGLPYHFGFIFVNDGSSDGTLAQLEALAEADPRVSVLDLSRNFGHQAAITAGLDQASADFVITMDGDGEHPPSMIAEMLRLAESGYDVVLTQRVEPQQASPFKRWTSDQFYRFINRIGDTRVIPGAGDFRLLNRSAAGALNSLREYQRFLRGMVAWMGFRTVILPYTPQARLGGRSKYSLKKMLRLATNAVFSFSLMPLYISLTIGAIFLILALVEAIYVLSFWVTGNISHLEPGWSSLMFVLLVVGGALMITLGFIGIYVGYIFQEVKDRPIYLIRSKHIAQAAHSTSEETKHD